MRIFLGVLAFWLSLTTAGYADVPADRLATLARGVNIITVFTQTPLARIYADLEQIKLAGLRHIRIFVDPDWILQEGSSGTTRLDQVVQTAVADGLGVILCMTSSQYPPDDKATSLMVNLWGEAWEHLARRYWELPASKLFFELANEPTMAAARWNTVQEEFWKRVRRYAPKHTILMTGTPNSTVWGLGDLSPTDDDDVVYTFHLYQPMVFTHQGAEWDNRYTAIRELVYPPKSDNLAVVKQHLPPREAEDLSKYLESGAGAIQEELSVAEKWAYSRHVHLVVTEFGVYRTAPPNSRAAWLSEARQGIEAAGFGWTIWEYDGGFGIAPDLNGCTATTRALGLAARGDRARCPRP
jgi:aryl-phospho-beta-D-glucosidase BglC (GH1 family)